MLNINYEEIVRSKPAQAIMYRILGEILDVTLQLPEVKDSKVIQDYILSKAPEHLILKAIRGKGSGPSQMSLRLAKGQKTEMRHVNGYFLRRAKVLGVPMQYNSLVMDTIKAMEKQARMKLEDFVPMVETALPTELQYQHENSREVSRKLEELDKSYHSSYYGRRF
jgi:ketopantoate reductase